MFWTQSQNSRATERHAAERQAPGNLSMVRYPWAPLPSVQLPFRNPVASPGPPAASPKPPKAFPLALQPGARTRKASAVFRRVLAPPGSMPTGTLPEPVVISQGYSQTFPSSKRKRSRSASVARQPSLKTTQGSGRLFIDALASPLSRIFKKRAGPNAHAVGGDSTTRFKSEPYGRRRQSSIVPKSKVTEADSANAPVQSRSLLSVCQSLSPCLSPEPDIDERQYPRQELQNTIEKKQPSSVFSTQRCRQRPCQPEGSGKPNASPGAAEGGFPPTPMTAVPHAFHTTNTSLNAKLVSGECKRDENAEAAHPTGRGRKPCLLGAEPTKSKFTNRLRHSNYVEEFGEKSSESGLEDMDTQALTGGVLRNESSRRWKSPPARWFRRADGVPLYLRPRWANNHLAAHGPPRSGRYGCWSSLAAGGLKRHKHMAPSRRSLLQLCTCYEHMPPAFSRCTQTSLRTSTTQDMPASLTYGRTGQGVNQNVSCKACDAVRCHASAQRRDQLQERLRSEERIKRIEEEIAIHQRSRLEEIVCLEEIKEEEETARLEKELLLGELCRGSNRRDFGFNAEGAGKGCKQFQGVWPPVEATVVRNSNVFMDTTRDRPVRLILEPLDSKSEVIFVQDFTGAEQVYIDEVQKNEAKLELRPPWHRRRCSAVDAQQLPPEITVSKQVPKSVLVNESEYQNGQSKRSIPGGFFPGPFTKQFSWNSAYLSPHSVSRSSQEEIEGPKLRQVRSALRDTGAPSRRRSSVKITAAKSQPEISRLAHSDDVAASESSIKISDAKVPSEPAEVPSLPTSQSYSMTPGSLFSTYSLKSLFAGKSSSTEQKNGRAADADSQAAEKLSTILLRSTLDEDGRVMRETGEPIQQDLQVSEEPSSAVNVKSSSKSSAAISSTQFETAAGESIMHTTETKALNRTEGQPLKEGGTQAAVRESLADGKVVSNEKSDNYEATNIISDTAVIAAISPLSLPMSEKLSALPSPEAAVHIEEALSPPPPAPKEVPAPAVDSTALPEPVEVFSGSSVLCAIACLVAFWAIVVLAIIQSIPGEHSTRKPTTAMTSTTTGVNAYLCNTQPCLREGEYLKGLLNDADHPCSNFYHYVCERWSPGPSAAKSRPDKLWSRDTILEGEMEAEVIKYITSNPENVQPIQALLQACNDRPLASSSLAEMRVLFQRWKIEEWPLPGYTSRPRDDVWILAGDLLRDVGLAALADVFLARDPRDDKRAIVAVDLPEPLHFRHLGAAEWLLVRGALKEALSLFDVTDGSYMDKFLNDSSAVFGIVEVLYQSGSFDVTEIVNISELEESFHKLITYATRTSTADQPDKRLVSDGRILLLDSRFARALTTSLRPISTSALLNHLGFRALVRLAAFLPESLSFLRQLSFLETAGRSEKPDTMSLCLRTLDRVAPGCFIRALTVPLRHSGAAVLRRHWISDLETVLLRALPRLSWLDDISVSVVAERIRHLQLDTAFFFGVTRSTDDIPCAALGIRVLRTPIAALIEVFRRRPLLSIGSWWRSARALETWPTLDLPSGQVLHVPPGLINGSVPANGSLFAFHLARVAVRLYSAIALVLHADSTYYTSFQLSDRSEKNAHKLLECMDRGGLRQWAAPAGSSRDVWLRRWLFDQTLALELGLHAFRMLSAPGRVWKLDQRFANLAHMTSTQLFFVYYALDHCELRGSGGQNQTHREMLLRRRLPAAERVNLPLRNLPTFTEAFGCRPGDALASHSACPLFRH